MNTNNLASLILIKKLKTIKVIFSGSYKEYTYKTVDDTIEVGNFVVVYAKNRLKVVEVVRIDNVADLTMDHVDYNWIVQKIDMSQHDSLVEIEEKASEKLRELEQQSMIKNAKNLLAEKLGVDSNDLLKKLTNE